MKILHILRSAPDQMVREFISALAAAGDGVEISLGGERVDYDQLIKEIFESQKVISWW